MEVDLATPTLSTPAGDAPAHPDRGPAAPGAGRIGRPGHPDRRAPRPRLDRCGRRRSLLPVGHRPPPASQARGGPGPSALPHHRARRRLPTELRRRRPARRRRPCPAPGSGCASSSPCCWRSCRRSCSLVAADRLDARASSAPRTRPSWRSSSFLGALGVGGDARPRLHRRPGRRGALVPVAGRARRGPGRDADTGDAYRQMAVSLDERNRQLDTLAREASGVPIDDEPRAVVGALVSAVRTVMRDPTWRCAVMTSATPDCCRPAVYHGIDEELPDEPIGELERWASVTGAERPARARRGTVGRASPSPTSRSAIGWGRSSMPPGRAGRIRRPAEIALLTLVGQHAGTALEHSLLYAQVRQQADELNRLAGVQADFLRGVTHDLQTPLTSIAALATELRAAPDQSAETRDDLDSIAHQAERLRRMVSQLLVASRLDAGVFTPQQEVFAVAAARRADVGRAPRRSSVRARRDRARRTWPSPTRTDWSRSCGPCSTTPSSTARRGSPVHAGDRRAGRDAGRHDSRPRRGDGHRDARARLRAVLPLRRRAEASRPTGAASASTPRAA